MATSTYANDDDAPIADINVTPLVDVVLVLLVVFIVTAKLIVGDALPLDLPAASTGSEHQTVLSIELGASGETAVNQQLVQSNEELARMAADARARDPKLRVVIKADGNVPHRRVIAVMDQLRRARISRIAFGVNRALVDQREAPRAPTGRLSWLPP